MENDRLEYITNCVFEFVRECRSKRLIYNFECGEISILEFNECIEILYSEFEIEDISFFQLRMRVDRIINNALSDLNRVIINADFIFIRCFADQYRFYDFVAAVTSFKRNFINDFENVNYNKNCICNLLSYELLADEISYYNTFLKYREELHQMLLDVTNISLNRRLRL